MLGIPITHAELDEAVEDLLLEAQVRRQPRSRRFVNAHSVVSAQNDADYARLLQGSGLNSREGMPVALPSRLPTGGGGGRVRRGGGPVFSGRAREGGGRHAPRHFFLGAT